YQQSASAMERRHARPISGLARAAIDEQSPQRRPLKPIMFCTTTSLASATSPCSRASSAHASHTFLVFPSTFTVKSSSASSPHDLQVGMVSRVRFQYVHVVKPAGSSVHAVAA